jgi:hypothetical protein
LALFPLGSPSLADAWKARMVSGPFEKSWKPVHTRSKLASSAYGPLVRTSRSVVSAAGPLPGVHLHAPLVRLGRPRRHPPLVPPRGVVGSSTMAESRSLRIAATTSALVEFGLAEVGVVLAVVGDVAPHPPRLEVVVRAQEERLAGDAAGVGGGDLARLRGLHLLEQAQRRVGAHDALVGAAPLLVQVALGVGRRPVVRLDVVDRGLVGGLGPLVGVVARDAPPHPVAGGPPPVAADGAVPVEAR